MTYKQELYETPAVLRRVLAERVDAPLKDAQERIFCGCGTSYYLGGQAAKLCCAQGLAARAVDAIELLEQPPRCAEGSVYVFISRSGNSQETVLAMEAVKAAGGHTFYLGCSGESRLAAGCEGAYVLPYANETLVLESYSFYAQLAALLRCCGLALEEDIPRQAAEALEAGAACYAERVAGMDIHRILCLSAPFYTPLAREMMLKHGEITQLPSESWGILEFRHGPRSWADEHCLILGAAGVKTAAWDRRVEQELISYGCRVLWYGGEPAEGAYTIPLRAKRGSAAEVLSLLAFHTALAVEIGQARGTTPERLRHVVHNVGEL